MNGLFRFANARRRDPAIERWQIEHPGTLGEIAMRWFNVMRNCGMDSEKYTGYAFGMGVERVVQMKYKINDIRLFFNNNVRFLRQFN